jgi:hypothetical protein
LVGLIISAANYFNFTKEKREEYFNVLGKMGVSKIEIFYFLL